jgi:hypothetical protein
MVAVVSEPTWWEQYRAVWRIRPWVMLIAIAGVALVVVALAETVVVGPLAFLFVPGLALVYLHHVIVRRTTTP